MVVGSHVDKGDSSKAVEGYLSTISKTLISLSKFKMFDSAEWSCDSCLVAEKVYRREMKSWFNDAHTFTAEPAKKFVVGG